MTEATASPLVRSVSDLLDAGFAAAYRTKEATTPWNAVEDSPTPAAESVELPEAYLSKQKLAEHYSMSVRWVEQRIRDGLPVADYMDTRPRFRLSETDSWLRDNGKLSGERPKAPRPGTPKGTV